MWSMKTVLGTLSSSTVLVCMRTLRILSVAEVSRNILSSLRLAVSFPTTDPVSVCGGRSTNLHSFTPNGSYCHTFLSK